MGWAVAGSEVPNPFGVPFSGMFDGAYAHLAWSHSDDITKVKEKLVSHT